MKDLLKNRTAVGIACIVLAFIICFAITPLFNSALEAQTEIVRVTKPIAKGEVITDGKIQTVKVGAQNLPQNIIKNSKDVIGKYVTAELLKGDYILNDKLTDKPYEENEYLYKLDGTKEAISVSIRSFALGLSGKLKSGDIVAVIASDFGEMRQTLIPPELQYIEVLAVTTSKGADEGVAEDSKNLDEEKQLPATITLLANQTQAKILAELEAKSKIHVALVYRGDSANAKKFLDAQDEALRKSDNDIGGRVVTSIEPSINLQTNTDNPVNPIITGGTTNAK